MSSWSGGLPPEAKAEMDRVLDAAITFAEKMLGSEGSFYPYSVALDDAGATDMATAPAGSSDVLAALREGLVAASAGLVVAAVVANVHLESIDSDAVRVDIEHRRGVALTVVVPYSRSRLRKKVSFGEMQAMTVEPRIWR